MKVKGLLYTLGIISLLYSLVIFNTGCAQIGAPTGGPRDTIPPKLLKASPGLNTVNFRGNKITLTFDEYVDVQDVQNNVLVSPLPKVNPVVDYKLKTVTVKLKDSLLPNTTYSINFGKAIRDNNEANPLKNFTYVFSTGNTIDSLTFTGKVIIAETGKADSTLFAMLYRNADDSAVKKRRPDYLAKLNGDGSFTFNNLSAGTYKIYALKDGDGGRTYNSKTELFAFADAPVKIAETTTPVTLYASAEEKDSRNLITTLLSTKAAPIIKKLLYTSPAITQGQGLNDNFELIFNKPLKKFDVAKLKLTDTAYKLVSSVTANIDSTRKKIIFSVKWQEDMGYRLIIDPAAIADSLGTSIAKTDTIRFTTKKISDYGNLVLRFSDLDLTRHPVLQFVQGEELKESSPITANEWSKKLFPPGEYDIRILFDTNNNGKWDAGNYSKKIQPEKVIALPQRLSIRANWDNERDIKL